MRDGAPVALVDSGGAAAMPEWRRAFGGAAPGIVVVGWNEPGLDLAEIDYALVWEPAPGRLARMPNLRLILSDAAGVGHILRDPDLPPLPIVRMVSEATAQRMGEYVCMASLALLRDLRRSVRNQFAARWEEFTPERTARETRVGVMGLGHLGGRAATMLAGLGFPVSGWSATPRALPGIACHAGDAALPPFLAASDILVNVLPETPATRGILCARTLALLPRGAGLVNAGRGAHLALADLFDALDRGHLAGAVLDVFDAEPLPADHPVWSHPAILVTAHGAAYEPIAGRARRAAATILAHASGEPIGPIHDPARGY